MNNSYLFKKLLFRNMIIVIIFAVTVAMILYYFQNDNQKNDLHKKQQMYLMQQRDKIDTIIDVALKSVAQVEESSYFSDYLFDNESNEFNVYKLTDQIHKTSSAFSGLGYSIALKKADEDRVISSNFVFSFQKYLANEGFSEETVESIKKILSADDGKHRIYTASEQNYQDRSGPIFIMFYKKNGLNNVTVEYFITFYKDYVFPAFSSKTDEGFAICKDDEIITAANLSEDIQRLISQKNLPEISDKSGFYIHTTQSNIYNWRYVYYVKKTNENVSFNIIITIILISTSILLFGFLISYYNTRRIYIPLKHASEHLKQYESEDTKNVNELEYIENAVMKLSSKFIEQESKIKLKFFFDLLYGFIRYEEIDRKISEYKLEKYLNPVNIIVFEFDEQFHSTEIIKNNICDDVSLRLNELDNATVFFIDNQRFVSVLVNKGNSVLKNCLKSITEDVFEKNQVRLMTCVGKKVQSLHLASESFNSAMFVLEYKYHFQKKLVVMAEEVGNLNESTYYYPIDIERELLIFIDNKEYGKARTVLMRLLKINLLEYSLNRESIVEFIYAIVNTVKRILGRLNMTEKDVFGEGSILYLELKLCEDKSAIEEKIMQIFDTIIKNSDYNANESESSMIERIVQYIYANYQNDISLSDISDMFDVTSIYISRLFKNKKNTTFKEFINTYRVQKAKEIMSRDRSMQINDIAKMVGFNSTHTFIRVFKQYEEVSPGAFMKNYTD